MTVPLSVDVKLRGVEMAQVALNRFNAALGNYEEVQKRVKTKQELTAASLLKIWFAFQLLTSTSTIASAVFSGFGAALGFIIDTILLPFLPLMLEIEMALFRFGAWFSEQGPGVRAALLLLGAALLFAFGSSTAIAIGVVLALLGLMYAWSSVKAAATVGGILLLAGAILLLAIKFGILTAAAAPWIAAALVIVGVILLLRSAWLALRGEAVSFEWPSLDTIKQRMGVGGGGNIPGPSPVVPAGGSIPFTGGGMMGGGSSSSFTDQSIGPIYVNAAGNTGGGRDAGIAFQAQAAESRRFMF